MRSDVRRCTRHSPYVSKRAIVASLGWVTPGRQLRVSPLYFFLKKPGDLFLVASSAVSPQISSSQKLTTFFGHRFITFYCFHLGVTPSSPRGCHPTPFYLSDLVSPLFFVNLPPKKFSFGCRVSLGAVRPPRPPSDASETSFLVLAATLVCDHQRAAI